MMRYQCLIYVPACMQVISAALDKPRIVKFKGALDLVTETDEASERAILQVNGGSVGDGHMKTPSLRKHP